MSADDFCLFAGAFEDVNKMPPTHKTPRLVIDFSNEKFLALFHPEQPKPNNFQTMCRLVKNIL